MEKEEVYVTADTPTRVTTHTLVFLIIYVLGDSSFLEGLIDTRLITPESVVGDSGAPRQASNRRSQRGDEAWSSVFDCGAVMR